MPGVGAFIMARYPAYFDDSEKIWHPMRKEVRFNASINNDDGLIANSYARKYSLTFIQARQLLDNDIRQLTESLDRDGEVAIGRIGTLSVTDHTIQFLPSKQSSGLYEAQWYIPVPSRISQATADLSKDEDTNEILYVNKNFDTDKNYYLPINKKALKVAASLIIVFLASLAIAFPSSNQIKEDKASMIPMVDINHKSIKQEAEKQKIKKESEKAEEAIVKDNCPSSDEVSTVSPLIEETFKSSAAMPTYYLIVGTFKSSDEAQKYISYNNDKGYELESVGSRTLHRVSAKASFDKHELLQLLNSSEFKSKFKEAWIWSRQ